MKRFRIKATFGAYSVICFKGEKLSSSYNELQSSLKEKGESYFFYKISLYRTERKNLLWHIKIFSSEPDENGHSFVGYSKRSRDILIELQNFNVLFGLKLPDINDPEYNKKKEYKLQYARNIYNKTKSDCLSKVKLLNFNLD